MPTVRQLEPTRRDAEQRVIAEIESWRAQTVPDVAAPLSADDLVRLLRDCIAALALDPEIAAGFTVNTVHYYRRKDIIDPPSGRTAAARYGLRHLWQIAGARLAGHLGLVTLAEARDTIRAARDATLLAFFAARVTDARARTAIRTAKSAAPAARPLSRRASPATSSSPVMIALPGDVWCIVPAAHEAHRSHEAAGELARALAVALRINHKP
ncbi:MAG: ATP-dependent Clp protease proteolytic subunit [Gemmatimonadetes bacterium]|nr:ATP-dependent Clp protease proteolytic subunit [Gemmatimonadota bacterium]